MRSIRRPGSPTCWPGSPITRPAMWPRCCRGTGAAPAFDGSDDFVGVGGPDEWFWVIVGLGNEAIDGDLKIDDRSEDAASQTPLGELGEEGLDGVEPGARGRGEVEDEARMAGEPVPDLGVFMGGVVVEDDMNHLAGRHLGLDRVEEANELLVAVALHAAASDLALENVECCEQRGRAVALVIMGHGARPAALHGQAGLSAVERLDLALVVDRKDDGMGRGIDVEADDVLELGGEGWILG